MEKEMKHKENEALKANEMITVVDVLSEIDALRDNVALLHSDIESIYEVLFVGEKYSNIKEGKHINEKTLPEHLYNNISSIYDDINEIRDIVYMISRLFDIKK